MKQFISEIILKWLLHKKKHVFLVIETKFGIKLKKNTLLSTQKHVMKDIGEVNTTDKENGHT